jgi:hypothetical protein
MVPALVGLATVIVGAVVAFLLNSLKDRREQRRSKRGAILPLLDQLDWVAGEVGVALDTGDWIGLSKFQDFRQQWLLWVRDLSDLGIDDLQAIESIARYFTVSPDFQRITEYGASSSELAELHQVHNDLLRILKILSSAFR